MIGFLLIIAIVLTFHCNYSWPLLFSQWYSIVGFVKFVFSLTRFVNFHFVIRKSKIKLNYLKKKTKKICKFLIFKFIYNMEINQSNIKYCTRHPSYKAELCDEDNIWRCKKCYLQIIDLHLQIIVNFLFFFLFLCIILNIINIIYRKKKMKKLSN